MKKDHSILFVFSILALLALVLLTGYISLTMTDSLSIGPTTSAAPGSQKVISTEAPETELVQAAQFAQSVSDTTPHEFLFVGDSRTVGMREAVNKEYSDDTCSYIAKEGEGYYWFKNTGLPELEAALDAEPEKTVILNLGVNDVNNAEKYIGCYTDLFERYSDTSFYIMSVNPVNDNKGLSVNNEQIEAFNDAMMEAFPNRYLNCYRYLTTGEWSTVDGLHYTEETYRTIHHYVIMMLQ